VTSRVPLRLRGEHDYALTPLPLPESGVLPPMDLLTQYAAVALFVERASAARSEFRVTAANAPAIAEICARLDGLPLAIELAAARVKLLPPEVLLARLSSQLLTGGARDLEVRQQTMRATIAWSVDLLHPEEQVLFRRLAVFVGGGTLEAIEGVCKDPSGAELLGVDLLDGLGALVDQSLIQQRREGESTELRFGLLHVIREYALEQLEERGESEALRRAHTAYYLGLAEQLGSQLDGPDGLILRSRLASEHDNLRAALDWALEHGAAETTARLWVALHWFWTASGHWIEQRQRLIQTLSVADALPIPLRAQLLNRAGYFANLQGNNAEARRYLQESLALFRSIDDKDGMGKVLGDLGIQALDQGHFERADQLFEESLRLLREAGNSTWVVRTLENQANLPDARSDYAAERVLIEQALALAESLGDSHDIAMCRADLGSLALVEGDDVSAEALLQEALGVQQRLRDANCGGGSLGLLGLLALERGDVTAAHAHLTESLACFTQIAHQGRMAATHMRLGMAHFAAGNIKEAEDAYRTGLRVARGVEPGLMNKRRITTGLDGLAEIALAQENLQRAARLLGASAQVLSSVGATPMPLPPRLRAERERVIAHVRQALGEEAWEAAFAAGEALSLDEALAEALTPSS
jgi:predicted ATPase